MKKILPGILVLLFSLGFSGLSRAAAPASISTATLHSFQRDFTDAGDVRWTETGGLYKATFMQGGQVVYAYYDKSRSELVALTRNLSIDKLPLTIQHPLRDELKKAWLTELFEVATGGETCYYATLENGTDKRLLRAMASGEWELVSRVNR